MDLVIEDLAKFFRADSGEVQAVHGVSLSVAKGQFFTLLGPSGK